MGESRRERVTVVIPTRDRPRFVPDAIRAALLQEDVDVEVVVVDDGSAPATGELLAALASERVAVLRNERPRGVAAARNTGLARASGEWVAFLDDDDVWSPDKLRLQLAAAERALAAWAYSTAVMVDPEGDVAYEWPLPPPETLLVRLLRTNVVPAASSNVVVRTDHLRALGGFDESFLRLADWDLAIRLAAAAPAAAVDGALVGYRQHATNMIRGSWRELARMVDRLERKHRRLLDEHGAELDRARLERWVSEERLRGRRARAVASLREGRRGRAAAAHLAAAVAHRSRPDLRRAAAILAGGRVRRRGSGGGAPAAAARPRRPEWLALYR